MQKDQQKDGSNTKSNIFHFAKEKRHESNGIRAAFLVDPSIESEAAIDLFNMVLLDFHYFGSFHCDIL